MKELKLIAITALVAFGLAACGKKGSLEAPAAVAPDGTVIKETKTEEHRPFVLDRLIR